MLQLMQVAAVTVFQFASLYHFNRSRELKSALQSPLHPSLQREITLCWNTHCCCIKQVERSKDDHHFGHQGNNLPVEKMYVLIRESSMGWSQDILVLTHLLARCDACSQPTRLVGSAHSLGMVLSHPQQHPRCPLTPGGGEKPLGNTFARWTFMSSIPQVPPSCFWGRSHSLGSYQYSKESC